MKLEDLKKGLTLAGVVPDRLVTVVSADTHGSDSGVDRKWEELSRLLQNNPETRDASGLQRKIIIFSEHRDTLNYLLHKVSGLLGNDTFRAFSRSGKGCC